MMKISYRMKDGEGCEISGDMPKGKTSVTIMFGGKPVATFGANNLEFIMVESDNIAQPYSKCYPDVMGATHTGDDNRYYKYTSNGYMLLEDGEWDYVTYLPDLRRLDDIRKTVQQKYEIEKLDLVIKDYDKIQTKMFDLLEDDDDQITMALGLTYEESLL